ncbi:MAG: hypothetical protein D6705_08770 [Deltaproteobacteria bacterium]|nr:MAG: hypothetical protein D6705_08770 [Deltaproteobacteria bacterium]
MVEDCHFEGNRADLTGGAVFLQGKTTVSDTTFVANTAGIDGCAMVVSAYDEGTTPADRTFDTVVVHQNACDGQGGALRVSSAMRCIDCDFGLGPTDNAPGDVSDYDDLHTNYADGLTFDCTIQSDKPQCPNM